MKAHLAFLLALGAASCKRTTPPTPIDAAAPIAAIDAAPEAAAPHLTNAPWNIVLISIDSLRADMPWAGYERPIAPRLTELYGRSIAYTRAYSTSSFTSKSVAGFLTGHYPSELGRNGYFFTRYLDPSAFLCTKLGASHIPCVGGHAHAYFGVNQAGFEYGFSDWRLVKGITFDYETDPYITSDKLTPLAIEMLTTQAAKSSPFLAWFHFMDPHDRYQTHEGPHFGKRARDLYDEEVFFTDLWIGKLVDFIEGQEWGKRTIIVVTADHGEGFGEHNFRGHGHELWDVLVHVPLFFHIPGAASRTIAEPRSHVDLASTFAELLGAKIELPGQSMVPELEGAQPDARDVIVDLPEDQYNERRRALIHGSMKLIAFGNDARFSLFDLKEDPEEKTDLWKASPERANEMRDRYKEASRKIKDIPPKGGIPKQN